MNPIARRGARAFAAIPKKQPSAYEDAIAGGSNALYMESLYAQWRAQPASLDSSWETYFRTVESGGEAKPPLSGKALRDAATEARLSLSRDSPSMPVSEGISSDTMSLINLCSAYQSRGHEAAQLDPLNLHLWRTTPRSAALPEELEPSYHGFHESDMDRTLQVEGRMGSTQGYLQNIMDDKQSVTLREVLQRLKQSYCGHLGVEYMHISNSEVKNWIRSRVESAAFLKHTKEEKMKNYERLVDANEFELFAGKKFKTTKRFGLDGLESFIPGMKTLIDTASHEGAKEFVIAMAHRGRLNLLANVLQKPVEQVLAEFQDMHYDLDKFVTDLKTTDWSSTSDVKYHLGTSSVRKYGDGREVKMTLEANPSHLETANSVALGRTRAKQFYSVKPNGERLEKTDWDNQSAVFPVCIHGDAAFAGQGICYESMQLALVRNFSVGGTVHVVLNNQVGFTTNPWDGRSTAYCSDIGKAFDVPVFHVNADDTFAVCKAFEVAAEYRMKFKKDCIIDLVGFRRFGHNEIDNPDFTQPVMYNKIRQHPTTEEIVSKRLVEDGTCTAEELEKVRSSVREKLETALDKSKTWKPADASQEWVATNWKGLLKPNESFYNAPYTGIPEDRIVELGQKLTQVPSDVKLHRIVNKLFEDRRNMLSTKANFDWGFAEALAYASLLTDGYHVRLTGQDVQRGTFSHRHAMLTSQDNERARYNIFNNINPRRTTLKTDDNWDPTQDQATMTCQNSILSEYAVLGFELGYSYENPQALCQWEAQFGDFVNTAQVIIDQFIAAGEHKWMQQSGLVMLLPHGYDGQGAEHSSCRLERFLQLADDDEDDAKAMVNTDRNQPGWMPQQLQMNICVANISTPANYFHILRRQCLRQFRKPLIICSPKKLLRHPLCKSELTDFTTKEFQRLIDERNDAINPDEVTRLVFCSGQIYYDLVAERDAKKLNHVAIVTVEQISPFPYDKVKECFMKYKNVDHGDGLHPGNVVWAQEEPKNNGAWYYVKPRFVTTAREGVNMDTVMFYAGRRAAAAPATGLAKVHALEQKAVVEAALYAHDEGISRGSPLLGHTT